MAFKDVPSFIIDEPSEPVRISADRATSRFHLPLAPDFEFDASIFQVILDRVEDGVYFVDRNKRIRLWNAGAEAITGYSRDDVFGEPCGNRWLCHVDADGHTLCSNGCPIEQAVSRESPFENDAYLQHKLGHRIPVRIKTWPLHDRQGRMVGAVEVFRSTIAGRRQEQLIEELSHLALIDDLTRLPNRRHFDLQLDRRLAELNRFGWPFGVLMIDLDHFKQVNDGFGHHVGDQVLHLVARTLLANCRSLDTVARWGGEEFCAIIANVGVEELRKVAEKFRTMVEVSGLRESSSAPVRVTISTGGAMARPNETAAELMRRADDMMYAAKRSGRNRVCI
jgi:diguanylate cyclase (GGDEF)-like protein/PAS domain S-box-containing protein